MQVCKVLAKFWGSLYNLNENYKIEISCLELQYNHNNSQSAVLELYDTLGDRMSLTHLQQLENYLIIMNEVEQH